MPAKLVIAVDAVVSRDGTQVTAGAVVYPVNASEPVFMYTDAQGRQRRTRFLSRLSQIPDYATTGVLKHLRQSTLSWATVVRPSDKALEAKGLAVGRCVERLLYQHPEVVQNLKYDEIHIYLPDGHKIPTELVSLTPQILRANSWRTSAARLLAKHRE